MVIKMWLETIQIVQKRKTRWKSHEATFKLFQTGQTDQGPEFLMSLGRDFGCGSRGLGAGTAGIGDGVQIEVRFGCKMLQMSLK